ncbi:MAG: diacylglycerol kinase family lipid kinase, partial [Dehalococcoidales bacterium]|nr:diacylglycerol kinase family lipid kinase [Dehalococcoidales bacterium]
MSPLHAKVIVNPVAGANSTHRKWPRIRQLLRRVGLSFDFQYTEGVGHAIELARAAVSDGWPLLVAVGGDGTVNEVANGILSSKDSARSSIGIVSTGTGSDFIRSIGIPRDHASACRLLSRSQRLAIDVGVVEYSQNGRKLRRFFVNSAGVGFDARVAEISQHLPKRLGGTVPYIIGLLWSLAGYHNKSVVVTSGSRVETKRILSVVVANGRYFGGGMLVAPGAEVNDQLLDVLTVGDMGKLELLKALPTIYKGTHISHPKVSMERASAVEIESSEELLVHADGEFL